MSEIKLSVIIPVYNTAKYLNDCIQSLLDQDFSADEYELIFVNDGSTDNSEEIIIGYSSPIIKYIYQKNQGVSVARNTALDIAKGKYIAFVDSDDFVQAHSLKQIIDIMNENNLDLTIYPCKGVDESTYYNESNTSLNYSIKKGHTTNVTLWGNIFSRHKLVENNIKFEKNLKYSEDMLFTYLYRLTFKESFNYLQIKNKIYNYRQRQNSAMDNSRKNNQQRETRMLNNIEVARIINSKIPSLETDCQLNAANDMVTQRMSESLMIAPTIKKFNCNKLIKNLKKEKLYPYKLDRNWLKKQPSFKETLVGYCRAFNRHRILYSLYCIIAKLSYKNK